MPLSSARLSRDNDLQNAAENRAPLKRGARGDAVKILQRSLIDLGFAMPRSTTNGTPDGIYGPESEATVKAFQSDNALFVDGIAGRETLAALDGILSASEREQRLENVADSIAPFPVGKWSIT
ncbi:MAG TPA: peptidoglycan-binding domain-containing protein [Xanthobacteraceae bacterium]|jgi:peptidoglycan hydrolase-like protein with peptidoglycan-binding domain|nr:peptidoglycan-binding domain-containing protein [Xanthobacteraceae bacterium]